MFNNIKHAAVPPPLVHQVYPSNLSEENSKKDEIFTGPQRKKRVRWLIIDTSSWIHCTNDLSPKLLFQELKTTEVKIVLPAQVVREVILISKLAQIFYLLTRRTNKKLDGLKEGSRGQLTSANISIAPKARAVISFLRQQQVHAHDTMH